MMKRTMFKLKLSIVASLLATVSLVLQGGNFRIGRLSIYAIIFGAWSLVLLVWGLLEKETAINKKQNKVILGIFLATIFIIIFPMIISRVSHFFIGIHKNSTNKYEAELKESFKDDWALYNYGQTINGENAISGIDINIDKKAILNSNLGSPLACVMVLDTGIDKSIQYLNKKANVVNLYDYYNNDMSTYDGYSTDYHGTYVASIIAKIAPNCTILSSKFMEGNQGDIEDAKNALRNIPDNVRIINCSWTTDDYDEELYELIKNNPDILFVCATGDSFVNIDENPIYPAGYDCNNIISVMAIDSCGNAYSGSGYGKNNVDIAAPGVNVKVTFPENDITYVNGTSVATAFVSAAAALILSEKPDLKTSEVIDLMLTNVTPILGLENKSEGMLNITKALQSLHEVK